MFCNPCILYSVTECLACCNPCRDSVYFVVCEEMSVGFVIRVGTCIYCVFRLTPWRGVKHPPTSSTEVNEKVELYLYSPSEPSWQV
jgi:hypothetical protein